MNSSDSLKEKKVHENLKEINQSLVEENKQLEKQIQQLRSNSIER